MTAFEATLTASDGTTRTVRGHAADDGPAPTYAPSANSLPEVRLPIPRDDTFLDDKWIGGDMSVTADGDTLPIDVLDDVRVTERATVLIGRGGVDLRERVQTDVDGARETHRVAEDLISSATSYTANVDVPPTSTDTNVAVQSASTTNEIRQRIADTIPDTAPVEVAGDELRLLQSVLLSEVEAGTLLGGASTVSGSTYSGGDAVGLDDEGEAVLVENVGTLDYRIPKGQGRLAVRAVPVQPDSGLSAGTSPEVEISVNGTPVGSLPPLSTIPNGILWRFFDLPFALDAGRYDVSFRVKFRANARWVLDVVAVYDDRFNYDFDNVTDSNNALSGPQLYPDEHTVEFTDAPRPRAVTGGRVESTWTDTSNKQSIAVSNDGGATYSSSPNTDTLEVDFADRGATVRWRATLSRFSSGSTSTPTSGDQGQAIQSWTLKADLENMPLVVGESFDGRLVDVLSRLAETSRGNFVFEFRRDGGADSVEFTTPGQRSSSRDPAVVRFESERSGDTVAEKAVVKGGTQRRGRIAVTARVGEAVPLPDDALREGSETVLAERAGKADEYREFERGADYAIDYSAGTLTALAGGRIDDRQTVVVRYSFRPVGEFVASGVSDPQTVTVQVPPLETANGCRQAARAIVEDAKVPRNEAELTLPGTATDVSVVADVNPSDLPTAGQRFLVTGAEAGQGTSTLRFESRQPLGDVVDDLRDRLSAVADAT